MERRMYQTAIPMMMSRMMTPAMILLVVIAVVINVTVKRKSIAMFIGQV